MNNTSFYGIISGISFLIRWLACYFTIGQIQLFKNPILNFLVPDVGIYILLMLITRGIVGCLIYDKLEIDDKYVGCIAYFVIYFIPMLIMWGLLAFLTWIKVLPIAI